MNQVIAAALEIEAFCKEMGFRHCIIGGVALHRWGEPRQTKDVDLTVLTGFGREEPVVDSFLKRFNPRRADAREFALVNRVMLLRAENGVGLDVALGALPFEQAAIARATPFVLPDKSLITTCSAEDLIVHKAFADRPQDWVDVRMVVVRQGARLNVSQILSSLHPLVEIKEAPEILDRLRTLLRDEGIES
jgi:hypothetical protein